jgi:hypothetical protein
MRVAEHDPATLTHALTLGRTRLRAHADDSVASGGARLLEAAIVFLGIKPNTGDIAGPGRQ